MSIVIDLDLPESSGQIGVSGRRRPSGLVGTILALAVLAVLTGPVARAEGSLRLAWSAQTVHGFFWLADDALYTAQRAGPQQLALTAHDLRTGSARVEIALAGPLARSYATGGSTLVSRFPPSSGIQTITRVFDLRTGRRLMAYPVPAVPLAYLGTSVAVVIDRDAAVPSEAAVTDPSFATGAEYAHRAIGYDLRTGAVRWSIPIPAGWQWLLPGVAPGIEGLIGALGGAGVEPANWLLLASPQGFVRSYDLNSGARRASRALGPLRDRAFVLPLTDTVVTLTGAEALTLTGYDPDTLTQVWRWAAPESFAAPFACGRVLCLQGELGDVVWAIDPGTGARWFAADLRARPAAGDVAAISTRFGERLRLVETATGRVRAVPGDWRVVEAVNNGTEVVVAQVTDERATLAVFDLATGALTRAGEVSRWSQGGRCHASAAYLACVDGDELRVWRRRSP